MVCSQYFKNCKAGLEISILDFDSSIEHERVILKPSSYEIVLTIQIFTVEY